MTHPRDAGVAFIRRVSPTTINLDSSGGTKSRLVAALYAARWSDRLVWQLPCISSITSPQRRANGRVEVKSDARRSRSGHSGQCMVALRALAPHPKQRTGSGCIARLPVMADGKLKCFGTLARGALLTMSGKRQATTPQGERLTATHWLLDVLARPEKADTYRVLIVYHPPTCLPCLASRRGQDAPCRLMMFAHTDSRCAIRHLPASSTRVAEQTFIAQF